tara:strand:+ start:199 stop:1107 length:909 start_codon:yes stop_codon:yes gene_type:complete
MTIGIFELRVFRGSAFHELAHMPRVVRSRIPVARSAREAWQMRCSFDLEQHIATTGKRRLSLLEEHTLHAGTSEEQTQRLVRCELVGEHLGGTMMGAITSKDLVSEISSNFFANRFDADHGATFLVEMVKVAINVHISGHQWCVPESEHSCFMCTRVEISVKITGVGALIEMQLERQIRASHAEFPQHLETFLNRAKAAEAPPAHQPSPTTDLEVDLEPCRAAGMPERFTNAKSAADPQLSRWQIAWALLLRVVVGGARKHRVLSPGDRERGAVIVRVGARHARLLLLCRCAHVPDEDEIVE